MRLWVQDPLGAFVTYQLKKKKRKEKKKNGVISSNLGFV
jgi:orotate phosphoribosyltransferase-like protein